MSISLVHALSKQLISVFSMLMSVQERAEKLASLPNAADLPDHLRRDIGLDDGRTQIVQSDQRPADSRRSKSLPDFGDIRGAV